MRWRLPYLADPVRVRNAVKQSIAPPGFLAVLAIAAVFVVVSGSRLPPIAASHFGFGGAADGFMPRTGYLAVMLLTTVGLPLLLVVSHGLIRYVPPRFINLP